jgi:CRISPR-associated protein Cmr1
MSKEHSLPSVRLPLETLTPLFLGGADPRGDPELRASSVRGALRFWLRALLGGCYGTDDQALAEIRRLEAETFGEAGGEGKAGASKIVVRVRQEQQSAPQERPAERGSGRAYLFFSFFSMAASRARDQEIPAWRALAPPYLFSIDLLARPGVDEREAREALYRAVRSAWLLLHLGGLGARVRRLGGALAHRPVPRRSPDGATTQAVPSHLNLPFALSPEPQQAARQLAEGLRLLRQRSQVRADANPERPDWEVLDPRWCRIWVFGERSWTSGERGWPTVADAIGEWLRETRRALPTEQRLVFGAPLVIPKQHKTIEPPSGYERRERRPSPLWLSVTRAENGNLLGVATLFQSRFLPLRRGGEEQLERLYAQIAAAVAQLPNVAEVHYA